MSYRLGIDLGTTYTAAAISRDGAVSVVELGRRSSTIPSVVYLREDETILAGEPADRRALTEPGRVAREFKRRIGDPTPIMVAGVPYSADRLASKLLRWVVDFVTEREGSPPASITITHPANWGAFKHDLLEQAIRNADLEGVTTITEPEAAAIFYASLERVETGTLLGVYDLGGGTFDAAVLRKTDTGFEILGRPEGIERLGGIDFDEAVFSHVRSAIGGSLDDLDPDDPSVITAVGRIRRDCVEAKEALSADTETVIPVMLPNLQTEVRLTRAEFEAMIRPSLTETIEAMNRALRSAGVTADELSSVLLVGGSSRIPLVSLLVGSALGRPISLDVHPKHAIPLGAAMVQAPVASPVQVQAPAPIMTPVPSSAPVLEPPSEVPAVDQPESGWRTRSVTKTVAVERTVGKPPLGLVAGGVGLIALVVAGIMMIGRDDKSPASEPVDAGPVATVSDTTSPSTPVTSSGAVAAGETSTTTTSTSVAGDYSVPVDLEAATLLTVDVFEETYYVTYEANYDPVISADPESHHLHFFWDLYRPEGVGMNEPSSTRGMWTVWDKNADGELVFDAWTLADRPPGAAAICVVPANSKHEVANVDRVREIYDCMLLPDIELLSTAWANLTPGDCVNATGMEYELLTSVSLVSCWAPHDAEFYAFGVYDDGPFPGLESLAADGDAFCLDQYADYVGTSYDESALYYDFFMPTADTWAYGDRELACVILADEPMEESARGSGM